MTEIETESNLVQLSRVLDLLLYLYICIILMLCF